MTEISAEKLSDMHRLRKDLIEEHNSKIRNRSERNKVENASEDGHRNLCDGDNNSDFLGLRAPREISLSSLTGITDGSRIIRPCQQVKTASYNASSRRRSPSIFLQHGYDWLSPEDQKILAMMVHRREAQIEEQEMSVSARRLWEQDRILYNKMMNEKRKQWNELVMEKRKFDRIELERRKEQVEKSFNQHLAELEKAIYERHKKCELRHKKITAQKRHPHGITDADTELHRLRRQQQILQEQARSAEHINKVQQKERRVNDNLAAIICSRENTMKDRRRERERRMVAALQMRQAIADRFEEWRRQNSEMLSSRMSLSEYRQQDIIQWKRKVVHDQNLNRAINHAHAMSIIAHEELEKKENERRELLLKEIRARGVQAEKENFILRSRQHALTTAAIRQQIKESYPLVA